MAQQFDFVAIGDIVVDAFIQLKDATILRAADGSETLSMRFGDKIPYSALTTISGVGNSPNAAVAAARLGLRTAIVTNIGKDARGRDCKKNLAENKVKTLYVREHQRVPTNYHFVLQYGAERTILVKHEQYPYLFPKSMPEPKWIYLSSLGSGTEKYHAAIAAYLKKHPKVKLAFQPGTFQMRMGTHQLAEIYQRTEAFFCNKEEARRILELPQADFSELLDGIHALGPKMVVITDGPRGLTLSDGMKKYFLPMYPDPKPPVSRTGAGDATSSTITAYLAMGYAPLEAFERGPINSMHVVQYTGAQTGLLRKERLEKLYRNKPAEYHAREIQ